MCGVIAISLQGVKPKELRLVRDLFLQSMIRGKHATGVSYIKDNILHTIKEPISADKFFEKHNPFDCLDNDFNLTLIGHTRYSTSNLNYNQPIASDNISIVHNGVITQETSTEWNNDSELILKSFMDNLHPLEEYPDASMAVCHMAAKHKYISFFRNGLRPLYYSQLDKGVIVASTSDILKRVYISNTIHKTEMNQIYYVEDYKVKIGDKIPTNKQDLQNV